MAPCPFDLIIFDLGRVLVDFDHMTICRRLAALTDLDDDAVYDRVFASGIEARFDSGEIGPEAFFLEVKAVTGIGIDYAAFVPLWEDIFTVIDDVQPLVRRLARMVRLFMLSNTNELHYRYCRRRYRTVFEPFDDVITSFETGMRKPEEGIYRLALDRAGVEPDRALFIDDHEDFVAAARDIGITGVVFKDAEGLAKDLVSLGVPF